MPLTRPKAAQINFDVTTISDPLLRFNSGQTGSNDKDAGFIIERGDDTNVGLVWDESADEFAVVSTTETGTTSGNITISAYANIRANAYYGDGSNLTGINTLTSVDVNTSLKMVSGAQLQFRDNQSYITENGGILLWNSAAGRGVRMYSAGTERVAVSYDGNLELKTGVDIVFEGATGNDFETTLTVTDPTADRTITLPDTSGTVALTSDITTNSISQGDSSLAVTDSGTGVATLVLDNATHTTFNSSGITLASGVFSGTATSAQYADLAEMYAGDKNYEVGTVVCVGGDKEVTECDAYADSKLAGVVSTNPAYLMNRDIEAEYPICVGFVGRVPVKVVGHIEKGDLLTTSEIKGFATKFSQGSYNPGCIIGLSLNDKKYPGEGTVEVLLKRS